MRSLQAALAVVSASSIDKLHRTAVRGHTAFLTRVTPSRFIIVCDITATVLKRWTPCLRHDWSPLSLWLIGVCWCHTGGSITAHGIFCITWFTSLCKWVFWRRSCCCTAHRSITTPSFLKPLRWRHIMWCAAVPIAAWCDPDWKLQLFETASRIALFMFN